MGRRAGALLISAVLSQIILLSTSAAAEIAVRPLPSFAGELTRRAVAYVTEQSHPVSGLVRDRARNFEATPETYKAASIAATGFGLAVLADASERGLIPRADARARIVRALRFVYTQLPQKAGWLYHFVDWATGERLGQSEVSTIDTGWLLAGALYAGTVFPHSEIAELAAALYRRADFDDMLTDGGQKPAKRTLSMGWAPETGYLPWQWDAYAEHMLLLVLGIGHPERPLPVEAWYRWSRAALRPRGAMGMAQPLFVHQYSMLFAPFSGWRDGYPDYFANSVLATRLNRMISQKDESYATYRAGFWGLSAGDSAAGYQAFSPVNHDGTVCPACAGASVMFAPDQVLADLRRWWNGEYRDNIAGRYGFADSLNVDANWYDRDVIGITVTSLYLSFANYRDGGVWRRFASLPHLQRARQKIEAYRHRFH